ncbi:MAG: hypothetical protein ABIY40_04470 [Rhodanobacteraceae bacterium]|nr:hypothetical protein [Pseudomonadota bacterium]
MPEILLQQIDNVLLERLRNVARQRECSVDDLIVTTLRHAFASPELSAAPESDSEAIGLVATRWDAEEAALLREAAQAFDEIPKSDTVGADSGNEWDNPLL